MGLRLKPLREQVIVITGATSGIGLVTARMAARREARIVLAARNEGALRELDHEITSAGGKCTHVLADVGCLDDVRRIGEIAKELYGGIDTWVNNAGVSIYGELMQVSVDDMRQLFETNFWGVVYGSRVAVEHMSQDGGALINIGSVLSDRAIPMQGIYCASKHAVKGFTDSLRMELQAARIPIAVTLIKPSAIDTPYTRHAKNYMERFPNNPPPVYAPETVATAILHCAQKATRELVVGGGGRMIISSGRHTPALTDRLMQWLMIDQQKSDRQPLPRQDNSLFSPRRDMEERGDYKGHVAESSVYTQASMHPIISGALMVGAGMAAAAWLGKNRLSH